MLLGNCVNRNLLYYRDSNSQSSLWCKEGQQNQYIVEGQLLDNDVIYQRRKLLQSRPTRSSGRQQNVRRCWRELSTSKLRLHKDWWRNSPKVMRQVKVVLRGIKQAGLRIGMIWGYVPLLTSPLLPRYLCALVGTFNYPPFTAGSACIWFESDKRLDSLCLFKSVLLSFS